MTVSKESTPGALGLSVVTLLLRVSLFELEDINTQEFHSSSSKLVLVPPTVLPSVAQSSGVGFRLRN